MIFQINTTTRFSQSVSFHNVSGVNCEYFDKTYACYKCTALIAYVCILHGQPVILIPFDI